MNNQVYIYVYQLPVNGHLLYIGGYIPCTGNSGVTASPQAAIWLQNSQTPVAILDGAGTQTINRESGTVTITWDGTAVNSSSTLHVTDASGNDLPVKVATIVNVPCGQEVITIQQFASPGSGNGTSCPLGGNMRWLWWILFIILALLIIWWLWRCFCQKQAVIVEF